MLNDALTLTVFPGGDFYQSSVEFNDGAMISLSQERATVCEREEKENIEVNICDNSVSSVFGE